MPPKQKEAKKGPTYKNPILPKDLVPADIKQPARELKSLKYPQTFPQPSKNDKKIIPIFQSWPAQEIIKAHDFGTNSQNRFQDTNHELIAKHLKHQNISSWKSIHQVQKIKAQIYSHQANESQKSIQEGSKSQQQIQEPQEESLPPKDPLVIETYERDETPQETQTRVKQLAEQAQKAAKDKKKAKKQEPKEEGPVKVKDVKMSDVRVEECMSPEAIWIGSQLQAIKLRSIVDSYTREPVWKKIYPQQNGVPQITKSGKYWVKLYYMGQTVKIEVDDRIPITPNGKQMFPTSQKRHEKWTLIITKALIKYMALAWPQEQISGTGLIIHALTGMISQSIEVKSENLERFQTLLNDSHYTRKDVFMSCHTTKVTIPPSNYAKLGLETKEFSLQQESEIKARNNASDSSGQGQEVMYEKEQTVYENHSNEPINPNILPGYSYLLGDYFTNGQFNMAFSKERSNKQAKLRLEYNNLSKINLNNKTREEKLQHRRKKKQLKELLALEEKKRLDFINEEKKQYHFLKLLNKGIAIRCEFQEKQILLAKKCRLNNLNQPPNYQLPQPTAAEKEQIKSMKSFSVIKATKQDSEVNPNIDDFSMIENVVDPLPRPQKGIWIKDVDFLSCFTTVQIIYNPTTFPHKSIEKVAAAVTDGAYVFDQNKEILVLERQQMGEDGVEVQNIELLFGYSYQQTNTNHATDTEADSPYCILQKFDFDQFSVTSNVTKLTGRIDSTLLRLKNQNNVFKIFTMCKNNFCYWVSSNAKFKLMSIFEYLEEFEGYKKKAISIEYPAIEGKSYLPISRFGIKETSDDRNSIILKINSPNPQFVKTLRFNLVKAPQQTQKFISDEVQGIILKSCEQKHLAVDYTRLNIEPGQQYDLVLESCPSENQPDGSCELIALIKNQTLNFDHLELVQPLKFIDKYRPNKYGLIFRERIFSNTLTRQGFMIKIVEGQQVQGGPGGADKKGAKKGGKQEASVEFVQKPLDKYRSIIVKLVKNKEVIYETIGTNSTTISNIRISNLKEKTTKEYFLEAYFDLREWPEACIQSQDTNKLCWVINAFGTDSIAIVRDTRQQQKQRQTRKSWEDQQPGRAERAKKSRRRFIILQKKLNGQQLTQEEEQIIALPRLTKKQQLQEEKKNQDKNKKGAKKEDKKAGKQVKKQEVEQKPAQIVFPKSIENCNYEIKNFLKTLQNFSVKKQSKPEDRQARIRSGEQLRAIKESQKMSDQNRINKMLRNVERRETIKLKERDKKDQLLLQLQELNRQFKEAWVKYIAWRNQDLEKDKAKQEKERTITDILKQEKPTLSQADLDKILNQYQQISGFNQRLYEVGIMLKKNIRILALSDKISGHLTGWQVQQLKAINQQIKNDKIEGITDSILNDMKTMLEETEKNPGIVVEKQNQAKKTKKGGKK